MKQINITNELIGEYLDGNTSLEETAAVISAAKKNSELREIIEISGKLDMQFDENFTPVEDEEMETREESLEDILQAPLYEEQEIPATDMITLVFKRLASRWFIDIESWPGDIYDLEMIRGANTFLDVISHKIHDDKVVLNVWTEGTNQPCPRLQMIRHDSEGATYQVENCPYFKSTVWLCNVTQYIFGGIHPQTIYFKVKA